MNPGPYSELIRVGLRMEIFFGQSAPWLAICGPPLVEQVWLHVRASHAEVNPLGGAWIDLKLRGITKPAPKDTVVVNMIRYRI